MKNLVGLTLKQIIPLMLLVGLSACASTPKKETAAAPAAKPMVWHTAKVKVARKSRRARKSRKIIASRANRDFKRRSEIAAANGQPIQPVW
jgi:hypothetical protein